MTLCSLNLYIQFPPCWFLLPQHTQCRRSYKMILSRDAVIFDGAQTSADISWASSEFPIPTTAEVTVSLGMLWPTLLPPHQRPKNPSAHSTSAPSDFLFFFLWLFFFYLSSHSQCPLSNQSAFFYTTWVNYYYLPNIYSWKNPAFEWKKKKTFCLTLNAAPVWLSTTWPVWSNPNLLSIEQASSRCWKVVAQPSLPWEAHVSPGVMWCLGAVQVPRAPREPC